MPIPVRGADSGCEMCPSSHPQMDASSLRSESSSSSWGGGGGKYGDEPKKQGGAALPHIRQVVCPPIAFNADVGGDV